MKLFKYVKKYIYFFVADYFRFFAFIYLKRWKPLVISVTGSSGKTTLLHLFEAQLKDRALFSHKANSAFGIPFHILGLERKTFSILEWPFFALQAPFKIFRKVPKEKIYVTEADAERPGEGRFIGKLLRPDITVWLSLEEAHGINYDKLVPPPPKVGGGAEGGGDNYLDSLKKVIAHEFGSFLSYTKRLAVLNKDNQYISEEAKRTDSRIAWLSKADVASFIVEKNRVTIKMKQEEFDLPALVPEDAALSVLAVTEVMKYLKLPNDDHFSRFTLPPGRSSVFAGKNNTTLIDSTYNATFDGMRTMLDLFKKYPAESGKWLVLGDMIEQGKSETKEHALLADLIVEAKPDGIILVGPRLLATTYPLLLKHFDKEKVAAFLMPGEALDYLERNIKAREVILFKGARFLEGIVERLLLNPTDAEKLCRREEVWIKRRRQWGV